MTPPSGPTSPLDELALRILTMTRIAFAVAVSTVGFLGIFVAGVALALPMGLVVIGGLVLMTAVVMGLLSLKTKPLRLRGLRLLRDDPGKIVFIIAVGRAPRSRGGAWYIVLTDENGRLLAPGLRLRDSKVVDEAVDFANQLAPQAKTARIQDDTGIRPIEGMAGEAVERYAG